MHGQGISGHGVATRGSARHGAHDARDPHALGRPWPVDFAMLRSAMKRLPIILTVLLTVLAVSSSARADLAAPAPSGPTASALSVEGRRPLVAAWLPEHLTSEGAPNHMFLWPSRPTSFVLFDDGLVVYIEIGGKAEGDAEYKAVRLDARERKALLDSLAVNAFPAHDVAVRSPTRLREDVRTTTIAVWRHGKPVHVSAAGELSASMCPDPTGQPGQWRDKDCVRDRAPRPFLHIYDILANYEHPRATRWLPRRLQVVMSPMEPDHVFFKKPEEWLPWPKDWPTLARKVGRPTEGRARGFLQYDLFLPIEQMERLKSMEFHMTEKPEQLRGVLFEGAQWEPEFQYEAPLPDLWPPPIPTVAD